MDYHNIFENIDIALSLDDEHRQLGLEDWKLPAFQHNISGKQCELHAAHFDSYEISPACCMSVSLNTLGMLSSSEDEGVTMPFSSPNLQSEPVRIGQMVSIVFTHEGQNQNPSPRLFILLFSG